MKLKDIQNYVISYIFPKRCVICDDILPIGNKLHNEYLCDKCKDKFLFIENRCKKCGAAILDTEEYCIRCNEKNKNDLNFEYGIGLCRYNDYIKKSIHRIKYEGRKEYLEFFGKLIAKMHYNEIKKMNLDCFIPVPIHKKRLLKRNYNQASVLSKYISDELLNYGINIKVNETMVKRIKNTIPLNKMSENEREEVLKNAFSFNKVNEIKNVCIVDDIYTTGSTINAIAKCLKEEGIKKVYFVTIAVVDNL